MRIQNFLNISKEQREKNKVARFIKALVNAMDTKIGELEATVENLQGEEEDLLSNLEDYLNKDGKITRKAEEFVDKLVSVGLNLDLAQAELKSALAKQKKYFTEETTSTQTDENESVS